MAGLDPAIANPHQIAQDAMLFSNHPMELAASSFGMTAVGGTCSTSTEKAWVIIGTVD
jgi:hypothetical protein